MEKEMPKLQMFSAYLEHQLFLLQEIDRAEKASSECNAQEAGLKKTLAESGELKPGQWYVCGPYIVRMLDDQEIEFERVEIIPQN